MFFNIKFTMCSLTLDNSKLAIVIVSTIIDAQITNIPETYMEHVAY